MSAIKTNEKCSTCGEQLISRTGRYCSCIEAQLPKLTKGSVNVRRCAVGKTIERHNSRQKQKTEKATGSLQVLEEKLRDAGLDDTEIDILFERGLNGVSLEDTAPLVGMRNQQQVNRRLSKIQIKLERAGLKEWLLKRVTGEET